MEHQSQSDLINSALSEIKRTADSKLLLSLGFSVVNHDHGVYPEEAPLFRIANARGRCFIAAVETAHPNGLAGLRHAYAAGYMRARRSSTINTFQHFVVIQARSCSTESAQRLQRTTAVWTGGPKNNEWIIVTRKHLWTQGDDPCRKIKRERRER